MGKPDRLLQLVAQLQHEQDPLDARQLLLKHMELYAQQCLAQEYQRIARDIYDDMAQYIARALHKLEMIQRLLERQQIQQARLEMRAASLQIEASLYNLRQNMVGGGSQVTAPVTLTRRERDVLRLIVEGMTNRAIAEQLSISNDTVKSHIRHIIQKLQVKDRTQAAVIATRQGWL